LPGKAPGDNAAASAILDRMLHHGHLLKSVGDFNPATDGGQDSTATLTERHPLWFTASHCAETGCGMNTNPEQLYTYKALLTVQRGKTASHIAPAHLRWQGQKSSNIQREITTPGFHKNDQQNTPPMCMIS